MRSPRQADVLVATGPLTANMRGALAQAYAAMPEPRWVMSVGDCAVDGGVFKGSYAVDGGIGTALPVDLLVRGCPPAPADILAGSAHLARGQRAAGPTAVAAGEVTGRLQQAELPQPPRQRCGSSASGDPSRRSSGASSARR